MRSISATSPVFVTIFARIFLKEKFGPFEVGNLVVTLVGVVIVMQPPFIFGANEVASQQAAADQHEAIAGSDKHTWVAVVVLFGYVFGSAVGVTNRALKVIQNSSALIKR